MVKIVKKKVQVSEYELPLKVEALEEGGFLATSNKLQGVLTEGKTVSEAVANALDVASLIIEKRQKEKLPISLKIISRKSPTEHYQIRIPVQVAT